MEQPLEFKPAGQYESGEDFVMSPATEAACRARDHMIAFAGYEPSSPDAQLAKQSADTEFTDMMRLTYDFVHSSAIGFAVARWDVSSEEIEDIVSETYRRAYIGLPGFRGNAQVTTWLDQIAFNRLLTLAGKKKNMPLSNTTQDSEVALQRIASLSHGVTDSPEQLAVVNDQFERLLEMIDELSPKHRAVIKIIHYFQLSHEVSAEYLGTTVGNSRVLLNRAMAAFHKKFPNAAEDLEIEE